MGTAAGLHLAVALARRSGAPCMVDIKVTHTLEYDLKPGTGT